VRCASARHRSEHIGSLTNCTTAQPICSSGIAATTRHASTLHTSCQALTRTTWPIAKRPATTRRRLTASWGIRTRRTTRPSRTTAAATAAPAGPVDLVSSASGGQGSGARHDVRVPGPPASTSAPGTRHRAPTRTGPDICRGATGSANEAATPAAQSAPATTYPAAAHLRRPNGAPLRGRRISRARPPNAGNDRRRPRLSLDPRVQAHPQHQITRSTTT